MPRALIIGGSLGGLCAGLLLRQAGWDVRVFERSAGDLAGRGAGIGTHAELFAVFRRLGIPVDATIGVTIASRICLGADGRVVAQLPFEKVMSSWARLWRELRRRLPDECFQPAMELVAVEQHADHVIARFTDGTQADGALLIGADGLRSTVRARCFVAPQPRPAGYVAWRGLIEERDLLPASEILREPFAFHLRPDSQMLSYPVPGADEATTPGRRGFNWVWYHPAPADMPADMAPTRIPPGILSEFRAEAAATLPPPYAAAVAATPQPFCQPIFDLAVPTLAQGRVALLGDAAFVARPHAAAGATKAALNAAWLADALLAEPRDVPAALAAYAQRAGRFGEALVARARWLGGYLEDPPQPGMVPDSFAVMRGVGAPLAEIPELAACGL